MTIINARTILASAARTASGDSGPISLFEALRISPEEQDVDRLNLLVNVSAVGGVSPSITLAVQWSHDGTTFFAADPADTFAAMTAVGGAVKTFTIKGPFYRLVWTLAGTAPSITFSVSEQVM